MRIMVLGVRGMPRVEGGVESHAEHLYPLLVQKGCDVECVVRAAHVPVQIGRSWRGVHLRRFWAPGQWVPGLEAFVHSLLGVFYALLKPPDILHIHSIGPALFAPLARLFGLRVVVTYHTQDFEREKWGLCARLMLRLGEALAIRFSNRCIVISSILEERVRNRFHRNCAMIPNGVEVFEGVSPGEVMKAFALEPRRYVLMVSRTDPGKRHIDLIRAFAQSGLKDWKLVLVGGIDGTDPYARLVLNESRCVPNVVITGFQTGVSLRELYSNAGIFVLPSSHEGLPVVLLEALSYGLPCLASNIAANLSLGLPEKHYFPLGNVAVLAERLHELSTTQFNDEWRCGLRNHVKDNYNWTKIAEQTLDVYVSVMQNPGQCRWHTPQERR